MGSSIKKFENSEKTLHGVLGKNYLSTNLKKGDLIKGTDLRTVVTKTNTGILPNKYYDILGRKVNRDLVKNHILENSDFFDG